MGAGRYWWGDQDPLPNDLLQVWPGVLFLSRGCEGNELLV